jgi:para-nitrobenzyl esterase
MFFGPASAQVFDSKEAKVCEYDANRMDEPLWIGSEDSLTVNVWTPGCDSRARPVIVYLHGGANWLESSRLGTYDGTSLSRKGDVVFVTLNYRLGIFGALDLSGLGDGAPIGAHANCVHDQLCAIDWVRRNISALGGDRDLITLVGESAGSMDISWMIAAGALSGKVRRVVMMSGVGSVVGFGHNHTTSTHSLAEGKRRATRLFEQLRVEDFEHLQAKSTEDILTDCAHRAQSSDTLFDMDTLFYPRVDENFAVQDPFAAAHGGAAKDLEILIGFTGYELGLWLTWDDRLDQRSADWAAFTMPFLPDALRADLASLYRRELSGESAGVQGMHLLSDAMFGAPSLIFADSAARSGAKCWMYRFDYPSADPRRGALHAGDLCFFLGTWNTAGGRSLLGESVDKEMAEDRQRLSAMMQDALIAFARTGNPNTPMLPSWPQFSSSEQAFARFDRHVGVHNCPLGGRGDFWLDRIAAPILSSSKEDA